MIKVFTVNGNGKIEFTKAELEKLLNDTYAEGQRNCKCGNTITWTNPYITPYISTTSNDTDASHASAPNTYTITTALNATDAKEISKHIDEILKNAADNNNVFNKLAKELGGL